MYANPGARDWRCAPPSTAARDFHRTLEGYRPTPLIDLPSLAAGLGVARVLVKDESSRLGLPAFKVLGASWAVARVLERHPERPLTLVTATDGNHGRAVARTARLIGVRAHVVVPAVMTDAAAGAIAAEGATVERIDGDYDDAVKHAAARADAVLVQDMAWPGYDEIPAWIVEGYETLLLEIDVRPDLVVVPVGVGSLAQAVIAHYRCGRYGDPSVLGVEPESAACVLASLEAGELRSIPTGETVMAGLNCGTPSSSAWPYLRNGLDRAVAVSDAQAERAAADLAALGVSSGPSGAATLAGLRAIPRDPHAVVVLLNTEGRTPG